MNSLVGIDSKVKDILILGKGPMDGLHNATLTVDKFCKIL